jgi:hypothetical protein
VKDDDQNRSTSKPQKLPGITPEQAERLKVIAKGTLGFLGRTSKRSVAAAVGMGKKLISDHKARVAAAQEAKFRACEAKIREAADFVGDDVVTALDEFVQVSDGKFKAREKFATHDLVVKLLRTAELRKAFYNDELQIASKQFEFVAHSGDLLSVLPRALVSDRTNNIKKKYYWSNSGNVAAAVILGGRNKGVAAAAVANSARVGHHNGKVKAAFSDGISGIRYSINAADLDEAHIRALRYARRVAFFRVDENAIAEKALFCLIYNNGNARCSPPNYGEFTGVLNAEFHNNFMDQMWTVVESFRQIDDLANRNGLVKETLTASDVRKLMKSRSLALPKIDMLK